MKTLPSDYTRQEWIENHDPDIGQLVQIRKMDGTGGTRDKIVECNLQWDGFFPVMVYKTLKGHTIWEDGSGGEYFIAKKL